MRSSPQIDTEQHGGEHAVRMFCCSGHENVVPKGAREGRRGLAEPAEPYICE